MGEWTGPWSDGSSEWDPYWMKKLDHKFGDDGLFWMSYEDLLKRFDLLDRTRLFDHNWTVVQQWTNMSVGWVTGFLNTKFSIEIKKGGPTVFQLCQVSSMSPWENTDSKSSSLIADTSTAWRASTASTCISSCKRRIQRKTTISCGLVAHGSATAASQLRPILSRDCTKLCRRS